MSAPLQQTAAAGAASATAGAAAMSAAEFAAHFEKLLYDLGQTAAEAVIGAYKAWQSGKLTTDELTETIATLVSQVNAGSRMLADRVATWRVGGTDLAPIGSTVRPGDDLHRLRKAAHTLVVTALGTADDITPQLERFARNEPADAGQQQAIDTYAGHGITGYRRHPEADACELCVWLVKAHLDPEGIGYVYPTAKPMYRHPGCRCTPIPTTKKERTR